MSIEDFMLGFIAVSTVIGGARIWYVYKQTCSEYNRQLAILDNLDKQTLKLHKSILRNIELLKCAQESKDDFQEYLQLLDSELNIRGIGNSED